MVLFLQRTLYLQVVWGGKNPHLRNRNTLFLPPACLCGSRCCRIKEEKALAPSSQGVYSFPHPCQVGLPAVLFYCHLPPLATHHHFLPVVREGGGANHRDRRGKQKRPYGTDSSPPSSWVTSPSLLPNSIVLDKALTDSEMWERAAAGMVVLFARPKLARWVCEMEEAALPLLRERGWRPSLPSLNDFFAISPKKEPPSTCPLQYSNSSNWFVSIAIQHP